jgi:hypothetical protein
MDGTELAAISALEDATGHELGALGRALEVAGGTFGPLAPALSSLAASRETGGPGEVDVLAMRVALRRVRYRLQRDPAAAARLEAADEAFWTAIRQSPGGDMRSLNGRG